MSHQPLILGHRGSSATAPENTLAAFSQALSDGADGIEFDVRLARDGVPVVIHDASLKRTGGIDRPVSQLSAAELQEIDVGSWFAAHRQTAQTFAGEKLPSLAQVFELFAESSGVLYIEMKCDAGEGAALAAEVVRLTRASQMARRVVVESFDLSAIHAVKKVDSGIRTAALFEPKLSRRISAVRRLKLIDAALTAGAEEIALHHTLASSRVIEKASRAGLATVVWTVDEPSWISKARSLGVKALIANNPATLVRHRDEPARPLKQ
jgi:glycerophosphoryl diester phosphodiesterase